MNRLAYMLAVGLVAAIACVVTIVGCDVGDTDWLVHDPDAGLLVDEPDSTVEVYVGGGGQAGYTMRLGSSLDADVTVQVDPDSGVIASPDLFVFEKNGADFVRITVQAETTASVPDTDEYRLVDIHHRTESADLNYDGLDIVYSVRLVEVLAGPVIKGLSEFTPGDSLTLEWGEVEGLGEDAQYLAQRTAGNDATDWDSGEMSGWIDGTSWTFEGLEDAVTYWYRVKGGNQEEETLWSEIVHSTQIAAVPYAAVDCAETGASQTDHAFDVHYAAETGTDPGDIDHVELWYRLDETGETWGRYGEVDYTVSPITDFAVLADGVYELAVLAFDAVGNGETSPPSVSECTVTVDTAGVAVIEACERVSGELAISVSWSGGDDVEFVELWYTFDSGDWTRGDSYAANPFTFYVGSVGENTGPGTYGLIVVGHNYEDGNTEADPVSGDSPECTETVDTGVPYASVDCAETGASQTDHAFDVHYAAETGTDPGDIDHVELWYRVDYGTWGRYGEVDYTTSPITDFAVLADGVYELAVLAFDAVGNGETSPPSLSECTVTVDTE